MKQFAKVLVPVLGGGLLFSIAVAVASQTYVPIPPPTLPKVLSKTLVKSGESLFVRNVLVDGPIEIYNYLGSVPCSSCHDKKTPLKPESLAKNFGKLREKINKEILRRARGSELPLQDPAMEALVHYFIERYGLQDYKLSQ